MTANSTLMNNAALQYKIPLIAIGAGCTLGIAIVDHRFLTLLSILVSGLILALLFKKNQATKYGLVVLVFVVYTNLSDVLVRFHGIPSILQPLVALLFFLLLANWLIHKEKLSGISYPAIILFGYLVVSSLSLFYARDIELTQIKLGLLIKDQLIALLIVSLLVTTQDLRRLVWTLILVSVVLGTISCYKYFSGSTSAFLGFGQTKFAHVSGQLYQYRIAGPVKDPNFFAMIMVFLLPICVDKVINEQSNSLRFLALWGALVTTTTLAITFSRGGYLALATIVGVLLLKSDNRLMKILIVCVVFLISVPILPQHIKERIYSTSESITSVISKKGTADRATIGRLGQMEAAAHMFSGSPLLGVGLNNYSVHYPYYAYHNDLYSQNSTHSAHSRYLEIAAEQGIVGLLAFGCLVWIMFSRCQQASRGFKLAGHSELESFVSSFQIGLIGHLVAAIFLHDSYPRYFWLIVGIALALPNLALTTSSSTSLRRDTISSRYLSGGVIIDKIT